jgi:hypothetical protein
MDRRVELIDALTDQIMRVVPDFDGSPVEYEWLRANVGITEEEDVRWINVTSWQLGTFEEDGDHYDEEEWAEWAEWVTFLENDAAVVAFLESMLARYRACATSYVAEGHSAA